MRLFGLARADAEHSMTKVKNWDYPSLSKKRKNAKIINNLSNVIAWH